MKRRSFVLISTTMSLMAATLVIWMLVASFNQSFYLMRITSQHNGRQQLLASLRAQLTRDLFAASTVSFQDQKLQLELPDQAIVYHFQTDAIKRTIDRTTAQVWSATRLTFAASWEDAVRGSLLRVEWFEEPPPRSPLVVARHSSWVMPIAPREESGS